MASVSSNSSTYVQWMWNANENPFSTSYSSEWQSYSDIENMIIEQAFVVGQTHAILDDYHIDFKHNLQISNNDINKQRHVKRTTRNEDDKPLRKERFMSNPIAPKRPYGGLYGFISPFIQAVVKDLNLSRDRLPSKNKTIVSLIVERAAMGIVEEGKKLGKQQPDLHQLSNNSKPLTETRDSIPADNGADIFFRFVKPSLWSDTKLAADFIAKTSANLNPSHFPPNFAGNFDADRDGFDEDWDN
ncbi:unnamed protein product [Rotaria sp. Silwood1]|nr:unnamed protein product [Rotaria sp. Silwood1]CAF1649352.1 unnamed protein product [Rotaria sp. Silwood1]CAF3788848.1 unnamed protein product [Rotaria sp. Silwood1]CAF3837286.1 unnamed protein product [Rotaria sp. Silwood1]CAF3860167.1 unnamed protein product [Rotaria sp. Silwood1]